MSGMVRRCSDSIPCEWISCPREISSIPSFLVLRICAVMPRDCGISIISSIHDLPEEYWNRRDVAASVVCLVSGISGQGV